jgi:hypothetical protein
MGGNSNYIVLGYKIDIKFVSPSEYKIKEVSDALKPPAPPPTCKCKYDFLQN